VIDWLAAGLIPIINYCSFITVAIVLYTIYIILHIYNITRHSSSKHLYYKYYSVFFVYYKNTRLYEHNIILMQNGKNTSHEGLILYNPSSCTYDIDNIIPTAVIDNIAATPPRRELYLNYYVNSHYILISCTHNTIMFL